jgi:demethylmenaquinone methyltransferase/2-methoxy-6-polyprenyl-1,4-benzoquinol methylase
MSNKVEEINPYQSSDAKHQQVRRMFDSIAKKYDLMNRMMTMGIDKLWRRRAVKLVAKTRPKTILDIATGTADLAIALARKAHEAQITGVDLSEGMIEIGRQKVEHARLGDRINLKAADALALPFEDNSFDIITVAYGVRNFEHLDKGYAEMHRVLAPGGMLCVLELTTPKSKFVRPFYNFYTRVIIPAVGRMVSKDDRAYTYLPESIAAVPAREEMTRLMTNARFTHARYKSMTFGTCTLYTAIK